jgi:hypothetical protein
MADDSDAAEAARAQAEARRKKIMEKAQTRMDKVSGEVGLDDEDQKESATNAARIRAARQRRYGKKGKATVAEKAATTDPSGDEKKQEQKLDAKDDSVEAVAEAATTAAESKEVEEVDDSSPNQEPKKKYVGVAKMRRNLILKKKKEAEEGKMGKTEDPSTSKTSDVNVEKKSALPFLKIPIYMHLVTILLLFLAGVDVGFQQYHEDVRIHDQLVFKEYGIPLIHGTGTSWKNDDATSGVESLDSEAVYEKSDLEDEFQENLEASVGGTIDPLFRVDLDELTKGSGILYQLARGAVSLHRLILQLVYHTPKSIFYSLLALPQSLLQTPPALCLVALVLRQIVGKRILNAGIPQPVAEEKDSGIDVVALVKQGVINFVSTSFPNAVSFYDAFSHLRSDMYIVMCGVFFGLAWTHMSTNLPIQSYADEAARDSMGTATTDEL